MKVVFATPMIAIFVFALIADRVPVADSFSSPLKNLHSPVINGDEINSDIAIGQSPAEGITTKDVYAEEVVETESLSDLYESNAASKSTDLFENKQDEDLFASYVTFAQNFPFVNNVAIASCKTAAADLMAQVVIAQTPLENIDWDRSFLFFAFGGLYSGCFQYIYQVNIFKKIFDIEDFTSKSWSEKIKDVPGLKSLMGQTALDLVVLAIAYLPSFYMFKASIFSGSSDPAMWVDSGISNYKMNFAHDGYDAIRVWLPADLVCFSVPLYLRLPVRHAVSFAWTTYLSFVHGGH